MKIAALFILITGLQLPGLVQADNLATPASAPPSFKIECGSCHIPFPPSLLTANDWRRVMANLDKHYGDNASLDIKTSREITDFLVRHAESGKKMAAAGDPPRITDTSWFKREHREVPTTIWNDPAIKSAANCGGCHQGAAEGRFGEREIVLPGGRKWED
jgi:hypothetical protein